MVPERTSMVGQDARGCKRGAGPKEGVFVKARGGQEVRGASGAPPSGCDYVYSVCASY